jgi:hypothetical protein
MKYLNIITTATPRADIHNQCFIRYVKILLDSNPSYIIRLFVNLDKPPMISEEEFEEAKQNILLLENRVEVFFSFNDTNPSFSLAARTLFHRCRKVIEEGKDNDKNIFFWLEDDWILYDKKQKLEIEERIDLVTRSIEEFFENEYRIILLTGSRYINGRPSLFKQDLFCKICDILDAGNIDPEMAILLAKQLLFNDNKIREPLFDESVFQCFPIFTDAGIKWRKERKIQKINRFFSKPDSNCGYTWKEEKQTIITICRKPECSRSDTIKQLCKKHKILYEEKILEDEFSVLPYYYYYDVPIGDYGLCLIFIREELDQRYIEDAK